MISEALRSSISEELGEPIVNVRSAGGGSINDAYQIDTGSDRFFVKINSKDRFPRMFELEAKGLKLLANKCGLIVPKPVVVGESGSNQFLVLEWMEQGSVKQDSYSVLGHGLAGLHRSTTDLFGLDHDNYIGSLPQANNQCSFWTEFFWEERMLPQLKLAETAGYGGALHNGFNRLEGVVDSLFPEEAPTLIHGDLWSGNYSIAEDGPSIFDPAVYYGHREIDLAMMKLFGGFPNEVFEAYNEAFPLEPGWESRIPFGQLYPLMVHVNLFGGGYVSQVQQILSRI